MGLTIQSISAANGTIGVNQNLTVNYSTSGSTSIDRVVWNLSYKNTNGGSQAHDTRIGGTTYTLVTNPDVIGPNLTNAKSTTFTASVTVYWTEYISTGAQGGGSWVSGASVKDKTFTMTFKDADVMPSSSYSIFPVNSNNWSGYIAGLSKIRASRNTTLKYGATVKSWTVKFGNAAAVSVSASATSYDSPIQSVSATAFSVLVVITITDSRGYTISSSGLTASFVPYQNPSITANAIRTDSSGAADDDGTYMKISASALIAQCKYGSTQQNGVTVQYRYKKGTTGSYTNPVTISSSGSTESGTNRSYSYNNVLLNLGSDSIDYSYTVEITATDSLGKKATRTVVINSAPWAMSFFQGGKGVAFGMKQTRTKRLTIPDDWRFYRNDYKVWDAGDITPVSKAGDTMTGQLKTSFHSSVAPGCYLPSASSGTLPNIIEELRYSSGAMGSLATGSAYTLSGVTIPAAWYNYIWVPHRSGGVNGAASGDNCNYGTLYLTGMTGTGFYMVRYTNQSIAEVIDIRSSVIRASSSTVSAIVKTTASGVTVNEAQYVQQGKTVMVRLNLKMSSAISGTVSPVTLVDALKPAINASATTTYTHHNIKATITSGGVVQVNGTLNANTNFTVQSTYILA